MIDKLIDRILELNNPTTVGLDTSFDYLPENMRKSCSSFYDVSNAIIEYNCKIIDEVYKIVPSVKVQIAYYEMYGVEGLKAFAETLAYAKKRGLIVISDVKRNDIGSTAACYSNAYIGSVDINGKKLTAFDSDFITVNGYLGEDGIKPFLADCNAYDKGIFVLVKTSNPSSGQVQDKIFQSGQTLYESMGELVEVWGKSSVGKYGFSDVGAVVGATHVAQAEKLRKQMPSTFFLIPGYGAQGGGADGLPMFFNNKGIGGIVNNSRGIICAYKTEKFKGQTYFQAAKNSCLDMQADIFSTLKRAFYL